jgi:hypothetical protein
VSTAWNGRPAPEPCDRFDESASDRVRRFRPRGLKSRREHRVPLSSAACSSGSGHGGWGVGGRDSALFIGSQGVALVP